MNVPDGGAGPPSLVDASDALADPPPAPRRAWRRFAVALLVLAVIAALVATVWAGGWTAPREESADASTRPDATVDVERTALEEQQTMDGTLGFGGGATAFAGADGVITDLPKQGDTVQPGQSLYELDGRPVVLLRGDRPAYRALESGVTGADVRRFEQALSELGYTGFSVDDEFTHLTAAAVERWQNDLGVPETGRVAPSDVWFAKGEVRISGLEAKVGQRAAPSAAVLKTGSTGQVVRVDVEVSDRDLVADGDAVEVTLPGGEKVKGEVTSVGSVAEEPESEEGGAGGGDPTVEVVITLDDDATAKADSFDQAPVDVGFRSARKEDVLVVPVSALIALPGGGHGVTVVDGDTVRDVPVETGMFADDRVEVTGDGVTEGTTVAVPE